MRAIVKQCLASFVLFGCCHAVQALAAEDFLHAPDRAEWEAGGLYDGQFDDGTPFQIQVSYPRPAGVGQHAAELSNAYWYVRTFTGERVVLAAEHPDAGMLTLVRWAPVNQRVETFRLTLAADLRSGSGTWVSSTAGKERAFVLKRTVLYDEIAVTRPAPPAMAGDPVSPFPFVFSALFPVLADSIADEWMHATLASCGDSTECTNTVMVDWQSPSLLSLDAATYGYSYAGPHGNSTSSVRHYRLHDGKMAQVSLPDFLGPDRACRTVVSGAIARKLQEEHINGFRREMLDDRYSPKFLALPNGLEFHFDPYEVGGYAQGSPSVFLPRAELGACVRNLPAIGKSPAVVADDASTVLPDVVRATIVRYVDTSGQPQRDRLGRPVATGWTTPLIARAISDAAKPDVIATGIAASTEVLLACQREQLSTLTLPFMRSESQQAHCYRY